MVPLSEKHMSERVFQRKKTAKKHFSEAAKQRKRKLLSPSPSHSRPHRISLIYISLLLIRRKSFAVSPFADLHPDRNH